MSKFWKVDDEDDDLDDGNKYGGNDKNDDDCKNGDRQDRVTRMCEDGCNLNN